MNLPEPHGYTGPVGVNAVAIFTADQMLAYGEEIARMERERCAKVADQYATSGGWTGRYFDGYLDAAKAIASALRDGWNAGDDYRDAIRKDAP